MNRLNTTKPISCGIKLPINCECVFDNLHAAFDTKVGDHHFIFIGKVDDANGIRKAACSMAEQGFPWKKNGSGLPFTYVHAALLNRFVKEVLCP